MTRRNYYGRTRLAGDEKKSIWKKLFRKKTRPKRKGKGLPLKGFARLIMKGAPAVSVIWLLFFGVYFLVDETRQSGLFRVQEVRASGLKNFGEQEMLSRVAPSLGKSLVSLDLGSMEEKILGDSWVKTVSFHKAYPDRLFVRVEERLPAAVVSDPLETVVVDPEGKILEGWSGTDQVPVDWKDLPVVLGIRVESLRKEEPAALDT
ncbi:MAG TPA: FtsQ-type POTRA domain-containing protein, partial [Nitrospiria bacterium]|nr:FtsQ-type POTRA domain-containing protein [Nitrospiria bacterium]